MHIYIPYQSIPYHSITLHYISYIYKIIFINILHLIYCSSSRAVLGAGCFLVPATALFSQVFDLQSFRLDFHGGSLHDGRPWHAAATLITEVRLRHRETLSQSIGLDIFTCETNVYYIYNIYIYINMHSQMDGWDGAYRDK